MDLLLLGTRLTAREALEWGLINRIADSPDEFLSLLQSKSPQVCRLARREIRHDSLARLAEVEQRYLSDLLPTADCVEGVQAFLEKRQPVWTGR